MKKKRRATLLVGTWYAIRRKADGAWWSCKAVDWSPNFPDAGLWCGRDGAKLALDRGEEIVPVRGWVLTSKKRNAKRTR